VKHKTLDKQLTEMTIFTEKLQIIIITKFSLSSLLDKTYQLTLKITNNTWKYAS